MKFRTKLFLVILIPSCVLVSTAVAIAIYYINESSEKSAREEFGRSIQSAKYAIQERTNSLKDATRPFANARFRAMIRAAAESKNFEQLQKEMSDQFEVLGFDPDYYAVRDGEGNLLLRKSGFHKCGKSCKHPIESWVETKQAAVAEIDGHPFVAVACPEIEKDELVGILIFGTSLDRDLKRIADEFAIELAVMSGCVKIFPAQSRWTPSMPASGELFIDDIRYLAVEENVDAVRVVLLRSMAPADEQKRISLIIGTCGLGLAIVAAIIVSTLVSQGISKPVEILVDATRRVGEGDYETSVDVRSRDEMGALASAFNEMTVNLRKRRDIMNKTLSRDVAEQLMKSVELGGERRIVSVMFLDIRGFTSASEGKDPVQIVELLNDLMGRLSKCIEANHGIINKYLGDGFMAMFGVPKNTTQDSLNAVRAAMDMRTAVAQWNGERAAKGNPPLQVGIGIHTGPVVAGNVGAQSRLEYTLIGETVNLSSRLCGKAQPGQILVSKTTFIEVKAFVKLSELEPVHVKGFSRAVEVYEVCK